MVTDLGNARRIRVTSETPEAARCSYWQEPLSPVIKRVLIAAANAPATLPEDEVSSSERLWAGGEGFPTRSLVVRVLMS